MQWGSIAFTPGNGEHHSQTNARRRGLPSVADLREGGSTTRAVFSKFLIADNLRSVQWCAKQNTSVVEAINEAAPRLLGMPPRACYCNGLFHLDLDLEEVVRALRLVCHFGPDLEIP